LFIEVENKMPPSKSYVKRLRGIASIGGQNALKILRKRASKTWPTPGTHSRTARGALRRLL